MRRIVSRRGAPGGIVAMVMVVGLLVGAPVTAAEEELARAAIDAEPARVLRALPADPPPESLSAGSHFVVSDERRIDVLRTAVAGRGGMLVGVGTDQIYLLAGWAGSELVVAMDFDQVVVDVHAIHASVFRRARTPDELVAWWSAGRAGDLRAAITADVADPIERARVLAALELSRGLVAARLTSTRALHARHGTRSYLEDQAQFDHVAGLVRSGRLRAVRGDLTARATMSRIGEAARALDVPVRVLYLSNAEKYFDYTPQFRANVLGLPMDARSVVLRTVGWGPVDAPPDDGFYLYLAQSGPDFRAWLADRAPANVRPIVRAKRPTGTRGLYTIGAP